MLVYGYLRKSKLNTSPLKVLIILVFSYLSRSSPPEAIFDLKCGSVIKIILFINPKINIPEVTANNTILLNFGLAMFSNRRIINTAIAIQHAGSIGIQ